LGLLGVAAGAFGAHALKVRLEPGHFDVFEVAVRYQMYHALALVFLGCGPASARRRERLCRVAGWAFTCGVFLFSGSLYALALTGVRVLGAITPFGGAAFLLGWATLASIFLLSRSEETTE